VATGRSNRGNQWTVPDVNGPATAADLGLSRKDIHEACQVLDTEGLLFVTISSQ
jgi:hypothetical protein